MYKNFISVLAIFICLSIIFGLSASSSLALTFPSPTGYVNDYEGIITNRAELEQKLSDYEKQTTNEITIVTTPDFQGTYIEDYAVKLFEAWKIGKKDKDNGVLIIVSSKLRQSRIEVGYGLEGVLTDATTGRIQDNFMIPDFKNNNYSDGINKGIQAVIDTINGKNVIPSDTPTPVFSQIDNIINAFDTFGWGILVVGYILFMIMGSTKSWWFGGVVGFILGIIIGAVWFWWWGALVLPIPLALLGLLIDFIISYLGPTGIGLIRFSGGRSSSGGSSFGGFGGGSSGGGGSSRSW